MKDNPYHGWIIRYTHCPIRDERANIGVVIHALGTNEIVFRFLDDVSRLKAFFGHDDANWWTYFVDSTIRLFEDARDQIANGAIPTEVIEKIAPKELHLYNPLTSHCISGIQETALVAMESLFQRTCAPPKPNGD